MNHPIAFGLIKKRLNRTKQREGVANKMNSDKTDILLENRRVCVGGTITLLSSIACKSDITAFTSQFKFPQFTYLTS